MYVYSVRAFILRGAALKCAQAHRSTTVPAENKVAAGCAALLGNSVSSVQLHTAAARAKECRTQLQTKHELWAVQFVDLVVQHWTVLLHDVLHIG